MQDAFAVFAAYTARTPAVKETLLRIAEGKMGDLVRTDHEGIGNVHSGVGSGDDYHDHEQHLRIHLSRVQALFIYIFILLFDGSVRARSSAERQVPVLRSWLAQLWALAKSYTCTAQQTRGSSSLHSDSYVTSNLTPNTDSFPNQNQHTHTHPHSPDSELDSDSEAEVEVSRTEPEPETEPEPAQSPSATPQPSSPSPSLTFTKAIALWHLYILTESLRRTYLVIDTTLNLYVLMKDGWAECGGAVLLSARAALWDAEMAGEWCRVVVEGVGADKTAERTGRGMGMEKGKGKGKHRGNTGDGDAEGKGKANGPLMVSSKMPGTVIDECKADEVDRFVRSYWKFVVGRDRVEWWEARDRHQDRGWDRGRNGNGVAV
jgi:hypothetical protein